MKKRNYIWMLTVAFSLTVFSSCQDNNRQNEADQTETEMQRDAVTDDQDQMRENRTEETTVSDRVGDEAELSTFSMGMTRADLQDDLDEGEGPFTIFAPNEAAFEALSQEELELYTDATAEEEVATRMNFMIVERKMTADSLRRSINNVGGNLELITMQGERLVATMDGNDIVLKDGRGNQARIIEADKDASNGVVHVIDGVLKPIDLDRNDAILREVGRDDAGNNIGQ